MRNEGFRRKQRIFCYGSVTFGKRAVYVSPVLSGVEEGFIRGGIALQKTLEVDEMPVRHWISSVCSCRDGGNRPCFQPIVNSRSSVFGYEVCRAGSRPLESPEAFFRVARENDMLWECEQACRKPHRKVRSGVGKDVRLSSTSVPEIFVDARFRARIRLRASRKPVLGTAAGLRDYGDGASPVTARCRRQSPISGSRDSRSRWTIWALAIRGFRRWPAAPRTI